MKTIVGIAAFSLLLPLAAAGGDFGDRVEDRLDRRGDRIENDSDRRGDIVNDRLDRRY